MIFAKHIINEKAKEVEHNGRSYLVAPGVTIVEGVMNGFLVLEEEFGKVPESWNGRPLVIGHPTQNGTHISANSPDIQQIGTIYNTTANGGKLKSEFWFDVELLQDAGEDGEKIEANLRDGVRMEQSTAYWQEAESTSGTHNGVAYNGVARNIIPDHVAVFADEEIGACSIKDGCGVPRVNSQTAVGYCGCRSSEKVKTNQTSSTELIRRVRESFSSQFSEEERYNHWVREVFLDDNYLISEDEDGLFQYPYSFNEDEEIIFGDPIAVETIYHDKKSGEPLSANLFQKLWQWSMNLFKEQNQMEKLIQELAANEACELTTEELSGMPETALQKLVNLYATHEEDDSEADAGDPPAADDTNQDTSEGDEGVPAWAKAFTDKVDALSAKVDGIQSNIDAEANSAKADIVGRLSANAACQLTTEHLNSMNLDALQALEQSLIPAVYVGNGAGFSANSTNPSGLFIEAGMPIVGGN